MIVLFQCIIIVWANITFVYMQYYKILMKNQMICITKIKVSITGKAGENGITSVKKISDTLAGK